MAVAVAGVSGPWFARPHLRWLQLRWVQTVLVVAVMAGVTAGSYAGLLGFGRRTTSGVNAYLDSPYAGWRIGLVIAILALISLGVGWLGRPVVGSLALATALTACWALDASIDVRDDRNWPIGMVLVAWAGLGGSLLLSAVVTEVRQTRRRREAEAREAEQRREAARRLAEFRAAEAARLQAERLAEEQRREAARLEAARLAADEQRRTDEVAAQRALRVQREAAGPKVKVAKVLSTSAAKVRGARARAR